MEWADVVVGFTAGGSELRVRPDPANTAVYAKLLPAYEAFETRARADLTAGADLTGG
jgi:hypothetical protein